MADQRSDIEKEIREQIRKAKAPPRRKGGGKRLALILLLLLAVAAGFWYVSNRDLLSMDRMRRVMSYNKAEDGAELFRYDSDRSASYNLLGDNLIIVSTSRIQMLGGDGAELWSKTVNFTNPAIALGAETAAVYDVGGRELYLFGARGLVRDMSGECENGVLAVSINASDYLALTTLKSGYRSAVTVYTATGERVFTFNSSERYISDACVPADNRHLGVVTLGESEGVFASRMTFYSFDSTEAISETTLSGSMVLSLGNLGGKLAALQDDRLTVFDADGALSGSCRYDYPYLRGHSFFGSEFAVLLLSRYRSGGAMRLLTVDGDGQRLGLLDERREIVDISAAGKFVAVLCADSLTIYTEELKEYATLSGTDYARRVIMRPDGTALLVGASRSRLFVPE